MHDFGSGSVYWQGEEYVSFPIEVEGFEVSGDQQLPTPKIRVANVTGMISSLLNEMDDLVGTKVVRKRTFAKYLDKAVLEKPNPKRINTIEIIEIKIANKTAWVAYHNYATFSIDDKIVYKAHWLESATAILTDKGWKLEMLHSTPIKND